MRACVRACVATPRSRRRRCRPPACRARAPPATRTSAAAAQTPPPPAPAAAPRPHAVGPPSTGAQACTQTLSEIANAAALFARLCALPAHCTHMLEPWQQGVSSHRTHTSAFSIPIEAGFCLEDRRRTRGVLEIRNPYLSSRMRGQAPYTRYSTPRAPNLYRVQTPYTCAASSTARALRRTMKRYGHEKQSTLVRVRPALCARRSSTASWVRTLTVTARALRPRRPLRLGRRPAGSRTGGSGVRVEQATRESESTRPGRLRLSESGYPSPVIRVRLSESAYPSPLIRVSGSSVRVHRPLIRVPCPSARASYPSQLIRFYK